ncbi:potassium-transporting ATPase subunit KdpC [Achromobacter pestifer]|uniref:Potassium-transporting ATPase KdpC subunit n=1 Tax=Achromobacter pestifer TaxID=1353889 RepID=A0A7D4HRN7_9BURK|nr:potassium-transporting ATPase subunit KdpC [Achromobacter pestifer]QKH34693.1 potassium-transporting ATPase subunit KdpC [Achromobacter pestifer]
MKHSTPLPRQGGILRPALVVFAALSLVTGLAYPFLTTGIAAAVFPHEAAGSLIKQGDRVVGSELIGQSFTSPGYFWGRPSATAPMPYNGAGSSGSNLGPRNPALADAIQARIAALKAADPDNPVPVPVDLVTASGSGLDPHISPAAAAYQAARVARARDLPRAQIDALIQAHTEKPWLGVLGDPAVNVLTLNLALDQLRPAR